MSIQKKLAYYLSSYSGSDLERALEENFSADELMEFSQVDLMSFDGTFKDQRDSRRTLDLKLGGGASDDVIYINPGFDISEGDNGHPVKGIGVGGATITVTTSPGTVKKLYRWLLEVPNNVMGIRITSSDATQLIQNFTLTRMDNGPFNNGLDETINTSAFSNERDYKDNMITVNTPFTFDRNTRIAYTVLAGKSVTLSLFFGARLDIVKQAQASVQRALDNKMRNPAPIQLQLPALPGTGSQQIKLVQPQLPVGQKTRPGAQFTRR